jgi:hypothetical protein
MPGWLQNYLSRHYHLTWFVLIVSSVALFKGLISGEVWATISGGALACFRLGDAVDTYLRSGQNTANGNHDRDQGNPH